MTTDPSPEDARTTPLGKVAEAVGGDCLRELQRYEGLEAATKAAQPFKEGDRVALVDGYTRPTDSPGWNHYRGILVPGNTAIVGKVEWNGYWKYWMFSVIFEAQWSIGDRVGGMAFGYLSKNSLFNIGVKNIRLAKKRDQPVMPPGDFARYQIIEQTAEMKWRHDDVPYAQFCSEMQTRVRRIRDERNSDD